MAQILEYAPKTRRTWKRRWAALGRFILQTLLLLILTLVAAVAARELLSNRHPVQPAAADNYWKVLYGRGYVVERHAGTIVFVWPGTDTHLYFRISEAAAQAGADKGAQDYVQTLIRYLRDSRDPAEYAASLRLFTGQDFQTDAKKWQVWASGHLSDVKGGDAVYRKWLEMRSKAAQPAADLAVATGSYNFRDPLAVEARWQPIYQREVKASWWNLWHVLEIAVLLGYVVTVILLSRSFARERRLRAIATMA